MRQVGREACRRVDRIIDAGRHTIGRADVPVQPLVLPDIFAQCRQSSCLATGLLVLLLLRRQVILRCCGKCMCSRLHTPVCMAAPRFRPARLASSPPPGTRPSQPWPRRVVCRRRRGLTLC
eukprot:7263143-Prymnesium_polylepis.2